MRRKEGATAGQYAPKLWVRKSCERDVNYFMRGIAKLQYQNILLYFKLNLWN
jgi:hypothetical protein